MTGMHPLIASAAPAAINTASSWLVVNVADGNQRLSLRMVSSWRSNKAVVTARAAGARLADVDGKVEGTRSDNGSLTRTSDGEQSQQQPWTAPEPVINLELCVCFMP